MSLHTRRKFWKHAATYGLFFLLATLSGCTVLGEQRLQPLPQTAEPPRAAPALREIIPPEPPKPEQPLLASHSREPDGTGRPYQDNGEADHRLSTANGYEEEGIASWYGASFQGHRTSSGEVFDMYKLSAAHRRLPMHTKINVTNLENGKSLTVTINDRGPFVPGRVLELSYAAAKALDMVNKGLARVYICTSSPVEGQEDKEATSSFFAPASPSSVFPIPSLLTPAQASEPISPTTRDRLAASGD
jgi:rare lipoprotein A